MNRTEEQRRNGRSTYEVNPPRRMRNFFRLPSGRLFPRRYHVRQILDTIAEQPFGPNPFPLHLTQIKADNEESDSDQ